MSDVISDDGILKSKGRLKETRIDHIIVLKTIRIRLVGGGVSASSSGGLLILVSISTGEKKKNSEKYKKRALVFACNRVGFYVPEVAFRTNPFTGSLSR